MVAEEEQRHTRGGGGVIQVPLLDVLVITDIRKHLVKTECLTGEPHVIRRSPGVLGNTHANGE